MLAVSEFQERSVDLIELALAENRILPTEDKDFGWLVFAARVDSPSVIPMRSSASGGAHSLARFMKIPDEHKSLLEGAFVVLRPGEARISRGQDVH